MRGRKPIPTSLKVLAGNPGKRPLPTNEPEYDCLEPTTPEELNDPRWATAKAEWERVVPELERAGVLKRVDRAAIVFYCVLYQMAFEAMMGIRDHGTFTRTPAGYLMLNPHFKVLNNTFDKIKSLWSEFGLTPSSRTRIAADLPAEDYDPVEEFRRRARDRNTS